MVLDHFYGVRELHDVDAFMNYFLQTGLYEDLMSRDAARADAAVRKLVTQWMDDGHSMYYHNSYFTEAYQKPAEDGYSNTARKDLRNELTQIRGSHEEAGLAYYEVGDTAFITMDSFRIHAFHRLLPAV